MNALILQNCETEDLGLDIDVLIVGGTLGSENIIALPAFGERSTSQPSTWGRVKALFK